MNTATYHRVERKEEESNIEKQKEKIMAYCTERGIDVRMHEDYSSGMDTGSKVFEQLKRELEKYEMDGVVVKSMIKSVCIDNTNSSDE